MWWLYSILSILILIIILYFFAIAPAVAGKMDKFKNVKFAHRGLYSKTVPENSMTAFDLAIKAGYGIELDVWVTKDGKLVVFHDADTLRMCGKSLKISESTYEELSTLQLLNSGEKIPLFSEVLSLIDGRVPLLVELKSRFSETDVCEPSAKMLDGYENFIIESFNPFILSWYRKNRPSVIRGQLSTDFTKDDKKNKGIVFFALRFLLTDVLSRPHFIAYSEKYKNNISLNICRNMFKAPVYLWTVKGTVQLEGCDGIIFESE